MRKALVRVAQVAITFALFSFFNAIAVHFEIENGISILFPATAIAILTCMSFGIWAAIGVVLATVATPWSPNADLRGLIESGLVSAVEGMIPYLVFRYRRDLSPDLRDMRSLLAFLLFGTLLNTGFSAIAGNLLIVNHPPGTGLVWREAFVWWIADFTAALLLATPILAFGNALLAWVRRRPDPAERPRTIANALQILAVIVLLGFGASFVIRMSLLNRLENERLAQQRSWAQAAEILNHIHENFLHVALLAPSDPRLPGMVGQARAYNEKAFAQLRPVLAHASPDVTRELDGLAGATNSWFSGANYGAHNIGHNILALHTWMARADTREWNEFAVKRRRIMIVVALVDSLVFLILVMAAAMLMLTISRPFAQLHEAITSMREDQPLNPARIESSYLEFRSLADALAETNAELQQRESELRTQTERAIAASKHKSDFLAKMSHELRTPLNSIIGFSDLIAEQDETIESAKRLAFLDNVSNSARHLLGLINDLLDVAKVESGKMKMHFENVDLRHAIANTVSSTAPLFVRKKQQVDVAVPDEPMLVRADQSRVEQVLLNLLSNANKFSPVGEKILVRSTAEEGNWRIEVRDRGIGITPEDQRRIFNEFEQIHTRGPNSTGTGLGLSLVKRFVEAHGGRVEVQSTVGQGSTFSVTFPRAT
jgi:signal transduction histidine kinase